MSVAIVKENIGEGLYKVDLVYDVTELDAQTAYNEAVPNPVFNIPPKKVEFDAWCTDYSTDIEVGTTVGIIDIAGWLERDSPNPLIIQAGWNDEQQEPNIDCEADPERDGILKPQLTLPKEALIFNVGLHTWWQKWIHFYRAGTILEKDGDYCTVKLDVEISPFSPLKWLPKNRRETITPDKIGGEGDPEYETIGAQPLTFENVEIDYMDCNGLAFEIDDHVVVEFETTQNENGDVIQIPKVIGFVIEPRPCCTSAFVGKINNIVDPDHGKRFLYYRDRDQNWKTREAPPTIEYDRLGWLGERQTLTFKTPTNRHYHGGSGLSNIVYRCGRALPVAPYNVIGACLYTIDNRQYPLIVCYLSSTELRLYYLNDDDIWIEARQIVNLLGHEGRAYKFHNIFYFSENGLRAVTYVTDTYRFPQPPFFQNGYLNVPIRFELNLTAITSISYILTESSRTLSITEINAYSTLIELTCEFAAAFDKNDLKTMTGNFDHRVSVYNPPSAEYAYYPLPTNDGIWIQSIEDNWCENGYGRGYPQVCETGHGYGLWSHYTNYGCATHEACYGKFQTTKNREIGTAGIKGSITTILHLKFDFAEIGKIAVHSNLKTYSQHFYTTYETSYNFWIDIWGTLDSIEYAGVSAPDAPEEAQGLITRQFVDARYTADFFGARIIVVGFIEDNITPSQSRTILVEKYPGGANSKQLDGIYTAQSIPNSEDYYVEIKIGPAFNLKSQIDASFTIVKQPIFYTVTLADPVANFLILSGDNKMKVYRNENLIYEKDIEYEATKDLSFKVNAFENPNMGIWNNLDIEFASNNKGDFMISDGETFGELRGYPVNKWIEIGLV